MKYPFYEYVLSKVFQCSNLEVVLLMIQSAVRSSLSTKWCHTEADRKEEPVIRGRCCLPTTPVRKRTSGLFLVSLLSEWISNKIIRRLVEEPGPFLWIITNVSSSSGERSPRPSCDVVCYVLSTVTHRWSRWTQVSFFSFEARVSHDTNLAPGSFWTRWTYRTGFSWLPTGSLKLHASNWNEKKTIRTSNSFPHLYLNRLWSNWTCCKFFPFSLFNDQLSTGRHVIMFRFGAAWKLHLG